MPRYKELGVRPVWSFVKELPDLMEYFPDVGENGVPERSFLWGILGTLRPDAWKQLLEQSKKARSNDIEEEKGDLIEIHPDILQMLKNAPLLSKGKGHLPDLNFVFR
jgi:hypothetical protein